MQIRCTSCTRTIALDAGGELPDACPHCRGACLPRQLGPFVPLRLVATGGMGEVYLARHAELGTEVALKLLPAMPPAAAASVRERFAREARLTARVQHPGVVKVLDDDVAGDRPYLVLEFVDGETLRQRLQHGALPVVQAARLAALTADVLAAAHQGGVLHRDVKPDNVMLARDGSVRVLDFGIARAMSDDAPLTRTGEILGTPEYMAPEQLLDGPEATDERTDVHALGVLLYELLTARSPFRGSNLFQALKLVESLVPGPPSSLRAEVPQALDAVVLRALQKRREDRYLSAAAFAAAVRQAVPEAALPAPATARSTAAVVLATAGALLLVFSIAGYLLVQHVLAPGLIATVGDVGQAVGSLRSVAHVVRDRDELERMLVDGEWARALAAAEQGIANGDRESLPIAREAFVLSHLVWPLAMNLPLWVGCCDERDRTRLFGSDHEAPETGDEVTAAMRCLATGDPAGAIARLQPPSGDGARLQQRSSVAERLHDTLRRRRLLLLAGHAAGIDRGSLADLAQQVDAPGDATTRLLSQRWSSAADRNTALVGHAARLPIDQPEHWLAMRCAEALGAPADPRVAEQHAEWAWQHGAGELAVLLDAALVALRQPGATRTVITAEQTRRLQRRVAKADADDAPASVALGALLLWAAGDHAQAESLLAALPARSPGTLQPFQQWLAATKGTDAAELALQRGLAACRIGDEGRARASFAAAATPAAALCSWLLDRSAAIEALPPALFGPAIMVGAELVRDDATQVDRLLAAHASPGSEPPHFLRLAVLAGAEVDFAKGPWKAYAGPAARRVFDREVNGGHRR